MQTWNRVMRVSLRTKVLSIFLATVIVVLVLSNSLYLLSTRAILIQDAVQQNRVLSKEISAQIENSEQGSQAVDGLLGQELRIASLVAKYALNPNAANVTNQQLVALTKEMGIGGITLLQPTKSDIVGVKSSDPKEIGLSTRDWSGWYTAFQELLQQHNVFIPFGQSGLNYWTGPWANANSDPTKIQKWGYFDDGTTNYIIDPWVLDSVLKSYNKATGPATIVQQITKSNPNILAITAFNPTTFGKKPIIFAANGIEWKDFKNNPVMFGSYSYSDFTKDLTSVQQAFTSQSTISFEDDVDGKQVLKTFVPVKTDTNSYVLGFTTNYSVIQSVLTRQFHDSLLISAIILLLVSILSYFVSGYIIKPLVRITKKVEQIADIQFDDPVPIRRNDEIGELANRVNVMSQNLLEYTHELHASMRNERSFSMAFLGMVTSSLIHELRNPIAAMKNFLELFPQVQQLEPKGQEMVEHMSLASTHANAIVNEFSEFIQKGKLNLGAYKMFEVVHEAIQMVQPIADLKGVEVTAVNAKEYADLTVRIDKDKFRQVLINLMTNGIDAIDPEASYRFIKLEIVPSLNEVRIHVTDSGHGIPRDQWEQIFTPFQSSKAGGFGLGLSLCNYIILATGGSLRVLNSDALGTTMCITLPFAH